MATATLPKVNGVEKQARSMKKHEACFHINELIKNIRKSISRSEEQIAKIDAGEEDKSDMRSYYAQNIEEEKLRLQALDMAGDALTRI